MVGHCRLRGRDANRSRSLRRLPLHEHRQRRELHSTTDRRTARLGWCRDEQRRIVRGRQHLRLPRLLLLEPGRRTHLHIHKRRRELHASVAGREPELGKDSLLGEWCHSHRTRLLRLHLGKLQLRRDFCARCQRPQWKFRVSRHIGRRHANGRRLLRLRRRERAGGQWQHLGQCKLGGFMEPRGKRPSQLAVVDDERRPNNRGSRQHGWGRGHDRV